MIPRVTMADKKIALNFNVYRNLHFVLKNQIKVIFKDIVLNALNGDIIEKGVFPPYRFTYTLFQASNRSTDVANVLSIVDKFACDALTSLLIIEDDNHKILSEVIYRYGGVDKENPRAELSIESSIA